VSLLRGELDGHRLTVSVRPESLTVGVDARFVVACDAGGRLYSVYRDGHTYRRGLTGRVLHKWQDAHGRHREEVGAADADRLVDDAAACFGRAARLVGESAPALDDPGGALDILDRGTRFDAAHARLDAARARSLYQPIGILPPDHYLSLVLQATQGCSFNSCTFCRLYEEPYRVKSPEEFATHVEDVLAWLGPSAALRRRAVFLGAANALAVPMARLLPILEAVERAVGPPLGVAAFVDGFTGAKKTQADYRALAAHGLRRVYIGLESGHDPLLAFVRKPATRDEAVEAVRTIKAAGVSVAVIVMVGLGGDRFASAHVRDTSAALAAMRLGRGDLVYFSDLVETAGTAYPRQASEAGIGALSAEERREQRDIIQAALDPAPIGPRTARYDVREFVW